MHSARLTPPQLLLSPREAARSLGLSERWLWGNTYPRGACIPSIRCGRLCKYAVSDLQEWIARSRNTAAPAEQTEEAPSC